MQMRCSDRTLESEFGVGPFGLRWAKLDSMTGRTGVHEISADLERLCDIALAADCEPPDPAAHHPYERTVRAILKALSDPSPEMLGAAREARLTYSGHARLTMLEDAVQTAKLRAMIDKVLE